MFCCIKSEAYRLKKEQKRISKMIDRRLQIDLRYPRRDFKLLILGAGNSGKSTVIKQIKIINGYNYTEKERKQFVEYIVRNILADIQSLIRAMNTLNVKYKNSDNIQNALLLEKVFVEELDINYVNAIKNLWSDSGIQECYNRRKEFELSDSAKYYFDNIDRLSDINYLPTQQDILRVRIPTTGINEYTFKISSVCFRIIDVGGQRSERRKWVHAFEDLTSIIFLAALNEYDLNLYESSDSNCMKESLALFRCIINNKWFIDSSIILFLNKKDLLEEKVMFSNLIEYFPQYDGPPNDPISARQFILGMYEDLNPRSEKSFSHFTCATDTENIRYVFESVKDTILQIENTTY